MQKQYVRTRFIASIFIMILFILSACGAPSANTTPTPETATPSANTTPLPPAPTSLPTESANLPVQNFVVWFPETLAPSDNPEVATLLNDQLNGFIAEQDETITIEFRLRRYAETGGILPTLRTANKVAPGALPDITLVRREDLSALIQEGIPMLLEGHLSTSIIGDLFPPALQMGRVQNQIYALPYVMDVNILAFYGDEDQPSAWTFEAILEANAFWNFPAGRATGLSNVLFLQYLAAGGTLATDGTLNLNVDALTTVFNFYEQAYLANLIDDSMLDFTSTGDYVRSLTSGDLRAGVMNASTYLTELDDDETHLFSSAIPTANGDAIALMNGWVWIVTAKTADKQATAYRFIDWMMGNSRQAEYAQLVNLLPSQRGALTQMALSNADVSLFADLLGNAVLMPLDNNTGAVARAIQTAFASVISGDMTAEEAVESVQNQFE
ncbi:MAG: extracellular solute-binding protein [Anaerolineae bacterium]|nr:extracellular solute-binding protein [Anaerolineae bacterium]